MKAIRRISKNTPRLKRRMELKKTVIYADTYQPVNKCEDFGEPFSYKTFQPEVGVDVGENINGKYDVNKVHSGLS